MHNWQNVFVHLKHGMWSSNPFLTNFASHNLAAIKQRINRLKLERHVLPVRPMNTWLIPLDGQTSGALSTLKVCILVPVRWSMANQLSRLWPTATTAFHAISLKWSECWSPRLARTSHYCQQLTLSVYLSVCLSVTPLQIASSFLFLFIDGIETSFGRQFSMWHSTKQFS